MHLPYDVGILLLRRICPKETLACVHRWEVLAQSLWQFAKVKHYTVWVTGGTIVT